MIAKCKNIIFSDTFSCKFDQVCLEWTIITCLIIIIKIKSLFFYIYNELIDVI